MSNALQVSLRIGAALSSTYKNVFSSAEKSSTQLGAAYEKTDRKLQNSNAAIALKNKLAALKEQQKATKGSSSKLATEINRVERKYTSAKREAVAYSSAVGDVTRQQQRLQQQSSKLSKSLGDTATRQRNQTTRQDLHSKALPVLGAAYAGSRVIGNAIDIEQQEIRLQTVINSDDGDAAAAVLRAREHARVFAQNTLASESDILSIEYSLNSAGLSEEAARLGTEIVSKVATVTQGLPEQVGEIIGTTFNNMGASIEGSGIEEKLTRIGDVLTKTQLKYQIRDFGQLGESMKMAASQANISKISLVDTAVALGLLNSAGLQGSQGGTAFSATLRQMKKASDELGFSIVRGADGQMDLVATLEEVEQALSIYDDIDERGQVIQDLFGDEGKRGLVALVEGLDKLKVGVKEVGGATGIVSDKYQLFLDSTGGQWTMAKQNLSAIGTTLVGSLLPALNSVLVPVVALAGWVGESIALYPELGMVIGGATLAIIGFTTAAFVAKYTATLFSDGWLLAKKTLGFFTLTSMRANAVLVAQKALMIGSAIAAGAMATKTGLVTAAQWLWNAALTANPIGLVIAGVAALAAAAYLIYDNWEPILDWLKDKFGWMGDAIGWVGDQWNNLFGDEKTAKVNVVGSALDASASVPTSIRGPARQSTNGQDEPVIGASISEARDRNKRGPKSSIAPIALAAALSASPLAAQPEPAAAQHNDNSTHSYQLTIQQAPGENPEELSRRVMEEIEQMRQQERRGALHDG